MPFERVGVGICGVETVDVVSEFRLVWSAGSEAFLSRLGFVLNMSGRISSVRGFASSTS